jgi:hypothetical protein
MSKNGCNVNYGTFLLKQYTCTGVIGSVAVLRIRDVYPGSKFIPSRIPDPNCFHPGSRITDPHQRLKYFNPKKRFLGSRKYDPNCLSRGIRILTFYPSRIPDPGVQRHPIQDPGSGSATLVIGQPRGVNGRKCRH